MFWGSPPQAGITLKTTVLTFEASEIRNRQHHSLIITAPHPSVGRVALARSSKDLVQSRRRTSMAPRDTRTKWGVSPNFRSTKPNIRTRPNLRRGGRAGRRLVRRRSPRPLRVLRPERSERGTPNIRTRGTNARAGLRIIETEKDRGATRAWHRV